MAQRGGHRPGSGRKPQGLKKVLHRTPVQLAEARIAEKLPWLVDKLMELAEGIHEERTVGDGAVLVYKRAPDRQAAEYLIDRIMGKPTQPVDVYDTARQLAVARGLDPDKVVNIFDGLKRKRVG
jgi:hypothetical protein